MTGLELRDLLWNMTDEQLSRPVVVHDSFTGNVYAEIKPSDVIVEDAGIDGQQEPYPDCIMVNV